MHNRTESARPRRWTVTWRRFPNRPAWLAVAVLCLGALSAQAGLRTIPVSEIRPGMRGYGLTVFSGTRIERFDVEVIDVVPNFLLRQDIILIRCSHPVTDHAGVIGGMSGSPIYIEGRLAGALAYGWSFNKDPMAGVTPIAAMMEVLQASGGRGADRQRGPTAAGPTARGLWHPLDALRNRVTNRIQSRMPTQEGELSWVPTPLVVSGASRTAMSSIEEAASGGPLSVLRGGGDAADQRLPLKPGAPIGVQLVRGDLDATGIGTVTAVVGDKVLAFGHPMFGIGDVSFPVTGGRIHTVVASLARSNKLGSPSAVMGALIQDRTAAIVADTTAQAPMIDMTVDVSVAGSASPRRYAFQVADHPRLTGRFVQAALLSAVEHAVPDLVPVTARITWDMEFARRAPFHYEDQLVSSTGAAGVFSLLGVRPFLDALFDNPFEPVEVTRLAFAIALEPGAHTATVAGVTLSTDQPFPGDTITASVRLLEYGGTSRIVPVPIAIPLESGGTTLRLVVGGGNQVEPPFPVAESLDDLFRAVRMLYPGNNLVVQLQSQTATVSVRGRTIQDLPTSLVAALLPASGADTAKTFKVKQTILVPLDTVLSGRTEVRIQVGRR